jgi:hypothetical protein
MTSAGEQIVNRFVTTLNERDFDGFEAPFRRGLPATPLATNTGVPATSTESTNVHWVPRAQISGLQMDRSMQRRINHYLEPGATLYFD